MLAFFLLASSSVWALPEGRRACTLGYVNSIFTPSQWPDRSLEQLAHGQLGVIDPRFDHFYLFLAYRRVTGKPVTLADLDRLRQFDPCWDDGSSGFHGKEWASSSVMQAARREWFSARSASGLPAVRPGAGARPVSSVMGYAESALPNCNPSAFRTAARTLRDRMAAHGAGAWVGVWAEGQDRVMQLCFDASGELPGEASPDAPSWLQADRRYQIAAAHFYAGHHDDAARLFTEIGADASSPWRSLGHYLAARARMRQAGAAETDAQRVVFWRQARELLEAPAAGAGDPSVQPDIARMLQRVRLKLEPARVFSEIDARLGARGLPVDVGQDVRDFDAARAGSARFDAADPGFAAWLRALRSDGVAADADIATASRAAFVAWLAAAKRDDPRLAQLLERAAGVPRSAPEYQTVQLHRIRLLPDARRAWRIAQEFLALSAGELNEQDRNRVKSAALTLAPTARDLASLAYREPIAHPEVEALRTNPRVIVPVLDTAGGELLNRALPLDTLYAIQSSPVTPPRLRRELLGVVWTRAFVLERWDLLQKLQAGMRAYLPPASAVLMQKAVAAEPTERRARAALFLLRHPGIVGSVATEVAYSEGLEALAMPNMHRVLFEAGSRENWWCSLPQGRYSQEAPTPVAPPLPAFLGDRERRQWRKEYDVLLATPNGTEFLAALLLPWAKAHPRDADLPPALRMVVRSARGGCITPRTRTMGRDAFRHLHRHFPGREETLQTPSWG
ncbi:hypothetical protein [Caenimonas aquaedulcis]|uniref:Uncharacterized protein n=1 Tax=Caenimonas aquaedulcis TaxID=2793270 RepID=A0A931H821_9BURK|nr:hypothetical protein [Caenimonas aquaedulcis]MBG9390429.1 hypothetical protein [Caenimonas aquaedulcis]